MRFGVLPAATARKAFPRRAERKRWPLPSLTTTDVTRFDRRRTSDPRSGRELRTHTVTGRDGSGHGEPERSCARGEASTSHGRWSIVPDHRVHAPPPSGSDSTNFASGNVVLMSVGGVGSPASATPAVHAAPARASAARRRARAKRTDIGRKTLTPAAPRGGRQPRMTAVVLGTGAMAPEIAVALLAGGHRVMLAGRDPRRAADAAERAVALGGDAGVIGSAAIE